MSKGKALTSVLDLKRGFHSEDGKHYRRTSQDMAPVLKHVEFLNHKVNEAPRAGNASDWRYVGSIPMSLLLDWLERNNCRIDEWARNDNGLKDKFKKEFFTRDFNKLHNVTTPRHASVGGGGNQILMPGDF